MAARRQAGTAVLVALAWLCMRGSTAQLVVPDAAALLALRPAAASSTPLEAVNLLQWNMHGECFLQCTSASDTHCDQNYPACKQGALAFLQELVGGQHGSPPDFAGIEQLNDDEFMTSGLDPARWGRFTQLCGGDRGFGIYPFDSATVYYDKTKWSPMAVPGIELGGCMEFATAAQQEEGLMQSAEASAPAKNYRAYVVQAFEHQPSGEKVIVAVSHNPHVHRYEEEIAMLKDTVTQVRGATGISKFIFIADTNVNRPGSPFGGRTSESVLQDVYPGAENIVSTALSDTCCAWMYVHTFDRIIAAGFPEGSSMATALPFKPPNRPPWVALNMHDPITGRLSLPAALLQEAEDARSSGCLEASGGHRATLTRFRRC